MIIYRTIRTSPHIKLQKMKDLTIRLFDWSINILIPLFAMILLYGTTLNGMRRPDIGRWTVHSSSIYTIQYAVLEFLVHYSVSNNTYSIMCRYIHPTNNQPEQRKKKKREIHVVRGDNNNDGWCRYWLLISRSYFVWSTKKLDD